MEFYIQDGSGQMHGPFDLMAMILKIRNGQVQPNTPVAFKRNGETRPAQEVGDLTDVFTEEAKRADAPSIPAYSERLPTFPALLRSGFEFLRQSATAIVASGVVIAAWLIVSYALIFGQGVVQGFLGLLLCFFCSGPFVYSILRLVRGNPVDADILTKKTKGVLVSLLSISAIFAAALLPGLIVMYLVLGNIGVFIGMPILFVSLIIAYGILLFPLFVMMDKELALKEAWGIGRVLMKKNGNLGNVFALVTVNVIVFPLLPVTLPITMGAIAELYDESAHNI